MTQPEIPEHVRALADARAAARERRDWETADRLRADLEHGGWRIVDKGTRYRLTPAHPPNVDEGDGVRYGSSASVPSRLTEPATALATVVLRATDRTSDLARLLDGLRAHAPEETQVVVVADDPSPDQEDDLQARQRRDHETAAAAASTAPEASAASTDGSTASTAPEASTDSTDASLLSLSPEVVWTSARVGHAAAINIGIRGAVGRIVVLLDDSVEPVGDFIEPLVRVLADPRVALCGPWGLLSGDLRHFGEAAAGKTATEAASGTAARSVAAIQGACQAFRRADYLVRGPLDERLQTPRWTAIWWSLVLRDEGMGVAPRSALSLPDLPLVHHELGDPDSQPAERSRLARRDLYRVIDRFGARRDLAVELTTAPDGGSANG